MGIIETTRVVAAQPVETCDGCCKVSPHTIEYKGAIFCWPGCFMVVVEEETRKEWNYDRERAWGTGL